MHKIILPSPASEYYELADFPRAPCVSASSRELPRGAYKHKIASFDQLLFVEQLVHQLLLYVAEISSLTERNSKVSFFWSFIDSVKLLKNSQFLFFCICLECIFFNFPNYSFDRSKPVFLLCRETIVTIVSFLFLYYSKNGDFLIFVFVFCANFHLFSYKLHCAA